MFETDKTTREWKFYLEDMRRFAEKVISYTDGLEQEQNEIPTPKKREAD